VLQLCCRVVTFGMVPAITASLLFPYLSQAREYNRVSPYRVAIGLCVHIGCKSVERGQKGGVGHKGRGGRGRRGGGGEEGMSLHACIWYEEMEGGVGDEGKR
jgi:hypothetical protein